MKYAPWPWIVPGSHTQYGMPTTDKMEHSSFDGLESATVEINETDRQQSDTLGHSTVGNFTANGGNRGRESETRNNDYDDVVNFK